MSQTYQTENQDNPLWAVSQTRHQTLSQLPRRYDQDDRHV